MLEIHSHFKVKDKGEQKKREYWEGIKTMRWFENHLEDIEEQEFSDEEENSNGKQKKNANELDEDN